MSRTDSTKVYDRKRKRLVFALQAESARQGKELKIAACYSLVDSNLRLGRSDKDFIHFLLSTGTVKEA